MTLVGGWHDFAIRWPGPAFNQYPWNNNLTLCVRHSMVGYWATVSNIRWTGTVAYDGTLYQHYPVWAGLPHAGGLANPYGPGYESEGGVPESLGGAGVNEPLTPAQVTTWQRIDADLKAISPAIVFYEHRQLAQTACPSERYAPLYAPEDEVSRQEYEDLLLAMYSAAEDNVNGVPLPRADRLIRATERHAVRVNAQYRSIADVSETANEAFRQLTEHKDNHPGGSDSSGAHAHG